MHQPIYSMMAVQCSAVFSAYGVYNDLLICLCCVMIGITFHQRSQTYAHVNLNCAPLVLT